MSYCRKILEKSPFYNIRAVIQKPESQNVSYTNNKEFSKDTDQRRKPEEQIEFKLTQAPSPTKSANNSISKENSGAEALYYRTLLGI